MSAKKHRIFIVDDHVLIAQGLSSLLNGEPDFVVVGISNKPLEVMDVLANTPVDILLTDIRMPGLNGAELSRQVLAAHPAVKVVALSLYNDTQTITQMMQAGVSGYVFKDTTRDELLAALRAIAQGHSIFQNHPNQNSNNPPASNPRFTERELEIIRLIAKEYSSKQIAKTLFISERTVEGHRRNILKKADAVNTAGLLKFVYQNNII